MTVMAVLTIAVRVIDSYMLPVVTVDYFRQMTLENPTISDEKKEPEDVVAVYGKPGLRVGRMMVKEGGFVQKGEALFVYDEKLLQEKIKEIRKEYKKQKLQYESLKSSRILAEKRKEKDKKRAEKDYRDAADAAGAAESAAYQDMEAAWQKYEATCGKEPAAVWETEPVFGDGITFDDGEGFSSGSGSEDGEEVRKLSLEEQRTAWETEKQQLYQEYIMGKRALHDIQRAGAESRKNARRQMEDAGMPSEPDCSLELRELEMKELKEELRELSRIKKSGAVMYAETEGRIRNLNADAGSILGDGPAAVLERVLENEVYRNCIPLSAIQRDGEECCLFLAEDRSTILGMETTAYRVPVTVLAQNEDYAAVEGSFSQDARVISGAEKLITEGGRVRIAEGNFFR